jgi:hypothetical protein
MSPVPRRPDLLPDLCCLALLAALAFWLFSPWPTPAFFAISLLLGLGWLLSRHRPPRTPQPAAAGLCPICDYDLRATPDRCPECGTRVSNSPPALRQDHIAQLHRIAAGIRATELVAFSVDPNSPDLGLDTLLHVRPDNADADTRAAAIQAFKKIMRPYIEQAIDGVIQVRPGDAKDDPQFCLVTLAHRAGTVIGAAGFILTCRDFTSAKHALHRILTESTTS